MKFPASLFLAAALLINISGLVSTTATAAANAETVTSQPSANTDPYADLKIYTENYPPLNYDEAGEAKGLSVDLLLEMFNRAGIKRERLDILVVPWERGYSEAQIRPNTILFSTTRTPAREKLFKWVGPIGLSRVVLIARRDSEIDLTDEASFARYRYGAVKYSRGDLALQRGGTPPKQITYLNSPLSAAHMLARGRVDAWAFERISAFWVLQKLGYRSQDFKVVHAFKKRQYYYAFQPDSDPDLITALQSALDKIRADGTMAAIIEGHIPGASEIFLQEIPND